MTSPGRVTVRWTPRANCRRSAIRSTFRPLEYTNTIGAAQLSTVWTDPDFKPDQLAFYYVRVLEIPTPRHTLFDAIALHIDPKDTGEPATIQERAYSSPIWYTPAGE